MPYYPDPDRGYYDPEEYFDELDARHEAAEEEKILEDLEAREGFEIEGALINARRQMKDPMEEADPETGCTFAEMSEDPKTSRSMLCDNQDIDGSSMNMKKGKAA